MKQGGGRLKGNSFERKISKVICGSFDVGKEHCYRTPGSGGHRQASKSDPGDLVISRKLAKLFPFSIECKCYKSLPLDVLLTSKQIKGQFSTFWAQAKRDASRQQGRRPLLVFQSNRKKPLCAVQPVKSLDVASINHIQTKLCGDKVIVLLFDKFMSLAMEGKI